MSTMYKIRPILKTTDMKLPTCMYKMPYLYEDAKKQPVQQSTDLVQTPLSVEEQQQLQQQLLTIVTRQEQLIASLTKLESDLGTADAGCCGKFTVTNLSSDERALRQLIDRQQRLIGNLTQLEQDITRLVDGANSSPATGDVPKNAQISAATNKKPAPTGPARPRDVCIQAPLTQPPQQIRKLIESIGQKKRVLLQTLYHSSTATLKRPAAGWTDNLLDPNALGRADYDLTFTVIFKHGLTEVTLIGNPLEPSSHVHGEANIVKQLEKFRT